MEVDLDGFKTYMEFKFIKKSDDKDPYITFLGID